MSSPWLWILLGYFAGALPFGVWICALRGLDPRQKGSGNIGATNVTRTAGLFFGGLTFLLDAAKAALPAAYALQKGGLDAAAIAGFAAVVGHCFPLWLKFKGGKGISSALGAFAVLDMRIALAGAALWLVIRAMGKTPGHSSLCLCAEFALGPLFLTESLQLRALGLALGLLCALRHKSHWPRKFKGSPK